MVDHHMAPAVLSRRGVAAGAVLVGAAALFALWRRRQRTAGHRLTMAQCWRHGLHNVRGFEPGPMPSRLPARYATWERLAAALPELNRTGRLRAAVDAMPVLSVAPGALSAPELRRARLLLAYLSHSYVHAGGVPWERLQATQPIADQPGRDVFEYVPGQPPPPPPPPPPALPAQLSAPWRQVSSSLGMPLVLTATDTDLWNCVGVADGTEPLAAMSAFTQIVSMTGNTAAFRHMVAFCHGTHRLLAVAFTVARTVT